MTSDNRNKNNYKNMQPKKIKQGTPISINPNKVKEIDVQNLSEQNIKTIQKKDAFMYYSIPGVRQADILLRDINYNDAETLSRGYAELRAINDAERLPAGTEPPEKIHRKSRVSTECHFCAFVDDINREIGN